MIAKSDLDIDLTTILNIVGDIQLPCDFYEDGKVLCQGEAAEWVMFRHPCCTRTMTPALACDCCKEARVMDMIALECGSCGKIWEHSPDAYSMIERLARGAAR